MALHPDVAGFLELVELGRMTGKSKPMHEMAVDEARTEFERASLILDASPPAAIEVQVLQIPTRDGTHIAARLYRKAGREAQVLPTILYLHGGGYVVGSLDSHDSVCRHLAARGDFAVLAPAYRRAPEFAYPTALHDCLDAANWLAEFAASVKLDAQAVAVCGDSVGATLATVLAIAAVHQPHALALRPKAQALFYPVTDTTRQRASHQQYAEGYLLENATLQWFYRQYAPASAHADWQVSPLLMADMPALAPAFLSLAEYDPLHDEGVAYGQHLQASGTPVVMRVEPGLTHDFLRMSGIAGQVGDVYQALNDWLCEVVVRG